MSGQVFAVKKGRKPGIYSTWNECKEQINGYSKPQFRKFRTFLEAWNWMHPQLQIDYEMVTKYEEFKKDLTTNYNTWEEHFEKICENYKKISNFEKSCIHKPIQQSVPPIQTIKKEPVEKPLVPEWIRRDGFLEKETIHVCILSRHKNSSLDEIGIYFENDLPKSRIVVIPYFPDALDHIFHGVIEVLKTWESEGKTDVQKLLIIHTRSLRFSSMIQDWNQCLSQRIDHQMKIFGTKVSYLKTMSDLCHQLQTKILPTILKPSSPLLKKAQQWFASN